MAYSFSLVLCMENSIPLNKPQSLFINYLRLPTNPTSFLVCYQQSRTLFFLSEDEILVGLFLERGIDTAAEGCQL